jgi:FkbM family methyltransferase
VQRGKGTIINVLNKVNFPGFECITHSKDGRAFWYDSRSRHGYQVFFFGGREWAETKLVKKIVGAGDIVMDIGANIGWYTTLFARLVGESGVVIAVEPIPQTMKILKRNLALNGNMDCVRLFEGACSDSNGYIEVHDFPTLHPGLASSRPIGNLPRITYKVPAVTIDHMVEQHQLEEITLIKIDVEGAELCVLYGGQNTFKRGCIEAVLLEANDERQQAFGYCFRECIDFLVGCYADYRAFRIIKSRSMVLSEMTTPSDYQDGDNILVVKYEGRVWKKLCAQVTIISTLQH